MEKSNNASKNKLQEHFQRENLPLPKYHSEVINGKPHDPEWMSTVELYDETKFTGSIHKNKVSAEMSAANNALRSLNSFTGNTNVRLKETTIAILVDLEYSSNIIDEIIKNINLDSNYNIEIYAFASVGHQSLKKDWNDYKYLNIMKCPVPTTRNDIGMSMFIGKHMNDYENIIIFTSEHFGKDLEDCMDVYKNLSGEPITTLKSFSNRKDLLEYLQKLYSN